jgi:hypothetical protein
MSSAPDPAAPHCHCCKDGSRKNIRELSRTAHAVMVGQGTFWDTDGRKHNHFGTPGGTADYQCECGHRWTAAYKATYFPCWCSWGTT